MTGTLSRLYTMTRVTIPDRGSLYIAKNPGLSEPADLVGQLLTLNGTPDCRVTGVETFAIARPYPPGLPFGVFVEFEGK